jgi:hypothetical protein
VSFATFTNECYTVIFLTRTINDDDDDDDNNNNNINNNRAKARTWE